MVGTFDADESTTSGIFFGDTNAELLVTSRRVTGTVGTAAGDVPPVGSVLGHLQLTLMSGLDTLIPTVQPLRLRPAGTRSRIPSLRLSVSYGDVAVGSSYDAITAESGVTALPPHYAGTAA